MKQVSVIFIDINKWYLFFYYISGNYYKSSLKKVYQIKTTILHNQIQLQQQIMQKTTNNII